MSFWRLKHNSESCTSSCNMPSLAPWVTKQATRPTGPRETHLLKSANLWKIEQVRWVAEGLDARHSKDWSTTIACCSNSIIGNALSLSNAKSHLRRWQDSGKWSENPCQGLDSQERMQALGTGCARPLRKKRAVVTVSLWQYSNDCSAASHDPFRKLRKERIRSGPSSEMMASGDPEIVIGRILGERKRPDRLGKFAPKWNLIQKLSTTTRYS